MGLGEYGRCAKDVRVVVERVSSLLACQFLSRGVDADKQVGDLAEFTFYGDDRDDGVAKLLALPTFQILPVTPLEIGSVIEVALEFKRCLEVNERTLTGIKEERLESLFSADHVVGDQALRTLSLVQVDGRQGDAFED